MIEKVDCVDCSIHPSIPPPYERVDLLAEPHGHPVSESESDFSSARHQRGRCIGRQGSFNGAD
jgi:hypothetical protein